MVTDRTVVAQRAKALRRCGANYEQWFTRVRGFCQTINPGWRRLLDLVQAEYAQRSCAILQRSTIDVLASHVLIELSQTVWMMLGNALADSIHPRRDVPAGGEEGNGLERLRMLYYTSDWGIDSL